MEKCHVYCSACTGTNSNQCSQCAFYNGVQYLLSNTTCSSTCLAAYYKFNSTNCLACTSPCFNCVAPGTNCTSCIATYVLFPPNNTCLTECPDNYYFNATLSQCMPCDPLCKKCTDDPFPCQVCIADTYLLPYNYTCWVSCPSPYIPLDILWLCLTLDDYYVNLTVNFEVSSDPTNLTILMTFSQPMDFTTFPYQTFQTLSFVDTTVTIDKF